jgi:hypothetical protein
MIIFQTDGTKKNLWRLDKFSGLAPDLYKRAKDGDMSALGDLAIHVPMEFADEYQEAFKETMNYSI